MAEDRLTRLGELDGYRVVKDDPDPRGWDVVTADGQRIGRVDDLIVDREAERAAYLDVHLERDDRGAEHRHVLVPTEAVRIDPADEDRRQVEVGATMDYLASVTPYQGLPLTSAQEAEYRACPPARAAEPRHTRITRGGTRHD